jgi:peroxidase
MNEFEAFCEVNNLLIQRGETRRATPCVTCTCTAEGPECQPIQVENCAKLLLKFDRKEIEKVKNNGKEYIDKMLI